MAGRLEDLEQAAKNDEPAPLEGGVLRQLRTRLRRLVGGGGDPDGAG